MSRGAEVARELLTFSDTPIIFVTGDPAAEMNAALAGFGVSGILTKPVPPAEIIQAIRRCGR